MIVIRPSELEIERRMLLDGEVHLSAAVDVSDEIRIVVKIVEPSSVAEKVREENDEEKQKV